MFGFVIGTLSLVGLIGVWKGRWHGDHRRWMSRRLFEYLDTTPGQEKVIAEVLNDVEERGRAVHEGLRGARGAFARAVRGEHFDGEAVSQAFESSESAGEALKVAIREGLIKVHEALGPQQRARLAALIERGPRVMHGGCGGRGHRRGPWSEGPTATAAF